MSRTRIRNYCPICGRPRNSGRRGRCAPCYNKGKQNGSIPSKEQAYRWWDISISKKGTQRLLARSPASSSPCPKGGAHYWLIEGTKPWANGMCKKCGEVRFFMGGLPNSGPLGAEKNCYAWNDQSLRLEQINDKHYCL